MPKDDTRILDAEDHLPDHAPSREAREVAERILEECRAYMTAVGTPRPLAPPEWIAEQLEAYAQRKVREVCRALWRRCPCGTEDVHDPLLGREVECRHCMARRKVREALGGAASTAAIHSNYPVENDWDEGYAAGRRQAAAAIRALIPKEPRDD